MVGGVIWEDPGPSCCMPVQFQHPSNMKALENLEAPPAEIRRCLMFGCMVWHSRSLTGASDEGFGKAFLYACRFHSVALLQRGFVSGSILTVDPEDAQVGGIIPNV